MLITSQIIPQEEVRPQEICRPVSAVKNLRWPICAKGNHGARVRLSVAAAWFPLDFLLQKPGKFLRGSPTDRKARFFASFF